MTGRSCLVAGHAARARPLMIALGLLALGACSEQLAPGPGMLFDPVNPGGADSGMEEVDAGTSPQNPIPNLDAGTGGDSGQDRDAGEAPDAREPDPADNNYGLPPFVADGEPIDAPDLTWTWVDFPNTSCRDGSPAGIAVSLNSASPNVMVYLEGGGACFDTITCLANPANVNSQKGEKRGGLFNRDHPDNPVADWNFVYVPYCTGDVHAGTNENGNVPGMGAQKFVGYLNMQAYLKRVVPTFPNVERVLLTGISAGGFGASANAVLLQRAFAGVRVAMIDDSGPPMPTSVLPSCLQKRWRETWGLDGSMLADCGDDCPNQDDYAFDYGLMLARKFDDRSAGLIEAAGDSIIRGFYGAGVNNCTGTAILNSVPANDFEAGLLEFRAAAQAYPTFGTWYPPVTQHTWLSGNGLYDAELEGLRLIDWVADIVFDRGTSHVGP